MITIKHLCKSKSVTQIDTIVKKIISEQKTAHVDSDSTYTFIYGLKLIQFS